MACHRRLYEYACTVLTSNQVLNYFKYEAMGEADVMRGEDGWEVRRDVDRLKQY